jgi:hypothetical protein
VRQIRSSSRASVARRKSGSRRVADFHDPLRRAATRVHSIASRTGSAIWTRFGAAPARFDPEGRIVTLDCQDRGLCDRREIAEGVRVLATSPNLTSSFVVWEPLQSGPLATRISA